MQHPELPGNVRWFVITNAELQMFGTPAVFCQEAAAVNVAAKQ